MKLSTSVFHRNPWLNNYWIVLWLSVAAMLLPKYIAPAVGHNKQFYDGSQVIVPRLDVQDDVDLEALLPPLRLGVMWLQGEGVAIEKDLVKRDFLNLKTQIRAPPEQLLGGV